MDEIKDLTELENVESVEGEVVDDTEQDSLPKAAIVGIVLGGIALVGGAIAAGRKLIKKIKKDRAILKEYYETHPEDENEEETE